MKTPKKLVIQRTLRAEGARGNIGIRWIFSLTELSHFSVGAGFNNSTGYNNFFGENYVYFLLCKSE